MGAPQGYNCSRTYSCFVKPLEYQDRGYFSRGAFKPLLEILIIVFVDPLIYVSVMSTCLQNWNWVSRTVKNFMREKGEMN